MIRFTSTCISHKLLICRSTCLSRGLHQRQRCRDLTHLRGNACRVRTQNSNCRFAVSYSNFDVLFRVKRSHAATKSTATAQETALDSEQACCTLHPDQFTYEIKLIAKGIRFLCCAKIGCHKRKHSSQQKMSWHSAGAGNDGDRCS